VNVREAELRAEHPLKERQGPPRPSPVPPALSLSPCLCLRRADDLGLCPGWGGPGRAGVREPGSAGSCLPAETPFPAHQREVAAELLPRRRRRGGAEVSSGTESVSPCRGVHGPPAPGRAEGGGREAVCLVQSCLWCSLGWVSAPHPGRRNEGQILFRSSSSELADAFPCPPLLPLDRAETWG